LKFIKKITVKIWRFILAYKYILSSISFLVFLLWFFCLPKELFNTPTSTVILDRNENLLAASIATDGQWRFPYNSEVPDKFRKAIVQFEDRNFESHLGVSIKGLVRAAYQNISNNRKISGGSTITMQLMRMSRGKKERTVWQKVIEIFWATRAEWRYSKDELLALYTSNAPMGGNVVGLDAAAWRYFGRPSKTLSWAETATLAVLPNAPSLIHPGRNRDLLLAKRNRLLDRLYSVGEMDSITWSLAKLEELPEKPHPIPRVAPHLLNRVINDGLKGKVVHTSIELSIQEQTNNIIQFHHQKLRENEIYNAAVLIMEVETGKIISYNGNVLNVEVEHGKDVDIISAPRSTGSILKPFLYAAMLQSGEITPKMLVQDIPTVMSGYSPKNYNLKYDGIVPADEAISRSLNVPLVRLLTKFGIEKFHHTLRRLDFKTINRPPNHYGLSLILGGAEVNLWDLVSAYGIMARSLNQYPDYAPSVNQKASYFLKPNESLEIELPVFNPATTWYTFEAMKEVSRPEDDINWELFSTSQQIAWKTGTSFGFRDAWAVGTNSKYVVGVWVGNADGEGRPGLIGREAAAPILFDVFSSLTQSNWFQPPFDEMKKVNVCVKSGYRANEACEIVQEEWIPKTTLNTVACPYHSFVFLDTSESYRVNSTCYDLSLAKKRSWFTLPAVAEYFYKNHDPNYRRLPDFIEGCIESEENNELAILYPKPNSEIFIPLNFEEENERIVFEATHIDENIKLYWHLDNQYIGETQGIHQQSLVPSSGSHLLTIIDEKGKSVFVKFNVSVSN